MTELTPDSKATDFVVPEGIQKAREAFLRDFATLIADRRMRGKYVCYHNEVLVAVAKDYVSILREAIAKNIPEDASLIVKVVPGEDYFHQVVAQEGELP